MLKQFILPILILLVITGCTQTAPANPSATPATGIEGSVTEGPMCPGPVPIGDNPCPNQPYQATITIFNLENVQVGQTQSDVSGYFKIMLPPGTYTLHPVSETPFPHAADQTVVVSDGQYTQVSILFDTGMR